MVTLDTLEHNTGEVDESDMDDSLAELSITYRKEATRWTTRLS